MSMIQWWVWSSLDQLKSALLRRGMFHVGTIQNRKLALLWSGQERDNFSKSFWKCSAPMIAVELDLLCSDSFYLLQHYPELRSVLLGRRWSCKSFAESTLQQIQRCDWRWRSSLDVRGQFRVAQLDASVIPAPETTHTVACWTVHRLVPST